jgi:pimeloyl-ACP methyl ester carboxylesterase
MTAVGTCERTLSVSVRGVASPVVEAGGAGAEEAVVLVHGVPGAGREWAYLLRRVGELGRAVAPDMPGFGAADAPESFDYTVAGYARHLGGLLAELGIARAHLVLHDFGGPWGLAWAAGHLDAVASVTLIDTGVLSGYRWHRTARIWRTPILGELFQASATRAAFRGAIMRRNPRLPGEAADRLYDQFGTAATKRAILRLYRATPAHALEGAAAALRSLDPPALVIWGTDDAYIPFGQAQRQLQTFPSARIELLEGHGHWPQLEDPWRVASLIVPFLEEQLGVGGAGAG